jgi:hypothetical protein
MIRLILAYLIIGLVFTLARVITDPEIREHFGLSRPDGPNYRRFSFLFVMFTLMWPLPLWYFIKETFFEASYEDLEEEAEFEVTQSDLVAPYSIDEIETRALILDPLGAVPNKPFGHLNGVWLEFKSRLPAGARLWSFGAQWPKEGSRIEIFEGYVVSDGKSIGKHLVVRRRRI